MTMTKIIEEDDDDEEDDDNDEEEYDDDYIEVGHRHLLVVRAEEKRVIWSLAQGPQCPQSGVCTYGKMPNMDIKAVRKVPFVGDTISPGPVAGVGVDPSCCIQLG
jgi:hypothetical protein